MRTLNDRFVLPHYASLVLLGISGPLLLIPNAMWPAGVLLVTPMIIQALLPGSKGWRGRSRYSILADVSVLLLMCMALVGLLVSDNPTVGIPKLQGVVYAASVYFVISRYVVNWKQEMNIASLLSFGCLGIVLLTLFGTDWESQYSKTAPFARVYELLPRLITDVPASHGIVSGFHPNEVSGVLVALIPIALGACLGTMTLRYRQSGLRKAVAILAALSVLLGIAYLVLSVSRTAWLSLGMAFAAMLMVILLKRSPVLVIALVAVLAMVALGVWQLHDQRATAFFSDSDLAWTGEPSAWGQPMRPQIWQRAFQMIISYPVAGIGLNMFPYVVQARFPFEQFNDYFVPHAHNLYLQAALDYGLPGLLSLLVLISVALAGVLRVLGRQSMPGGLALGVFGSLVAILVFGSLDAVAVGAKPTFLFWSVFALAVAMRKIGHHEEVSGRGSPDGTDVPLGQHRDAPFDTINPRR